VILLLMLLLAFPIMVHATHIERGCKAPPPVMEIPHWVSSYMCDFHAPGRQFGAVAVDMIQEDGSRVEVIAIYTTVEGVGDMDEFIATMVFEIKGNNTRGRLLLFGTADGSKKYVAHGAPAGLDL